MSPPRSDSAEVDRVFKFFDEGAQFAFQTNIRHALCCNLGELLPICSVISRIVLRPLLRSLVVVTLPAGHRLIPADGAVAPGFG